MEKVIMKKNTATPKMAVKNLLSIFLLYHKQDIKSTPNISKKRLTLY
jgi:hypothetical protein